MREQSYPNGVFQIQRWIKCPFILAKPAPGKYTEPRNLGIAPARGVRRGAARREEETGGGREREKKETGVKGAGRVEEVRQT